MFDFVTPIFKKTGRLLLILALFASGGGHWMVLQSVAWSAMMVQFSRGPGLVAAVERTFDGRHPCALCKKIAEGRKNEKKPDAQSDAGKFEFCLQSIPAIILPPRHFWRQEFPDADTRQFVPQPPVPPPRGFVS